MIKLRFESIDLIKHRLALDNYYQHPDTPKANRGDDMFKVHLYNGLDGFCTLVINEKEEIVSTYTGHLMYLGDQQVIKFCHRFHIRRDYSKHSHYIVEENCERMGYDWITQMGLEDLPVFMTINEGNERALYGLSRIHFMKKNHYQHFNKFGQNFVKTPHIWLPYLIMEHGVWQYASWVSPKGVKWNPCWRPERKEIAPEVLAKMNRRFPRHQETGGWYYVVRD